MTALECASEYFQKWAAYPEPRLGEIIASIKKIRKGQHQPED